MTRALVTAFEPFGGENVNASLQAVRRLPPRIGTLDVVTAELPTSYARASDALVMHICSTHADLVLCVGQAADRAHLCVERVAINVQDARIADNDGALPRDQPIVPDGPAAYFATLPVRAAVTALLGAGLPAELSNSAGTFVCNHVFYGLMHYAATRQLQLRGGLLHVPRLRGRDFGRHIPEDAAEGMALDDVVRGIVIVLEVMSAK